MRATVKKPDRNVSKEVDTFNEYALSVGYFILIDGQICINTKSDLSYANLESGFRDSQNRKNAKPKALRFKR